jgi:hypothetical protein
VDYRKYLVGAALAAAAAAPAAAASAPNSKDATAKALILIPLTLTKLQDLDFGTVVTSSSSGTVTIPADGSTEIVTGGVTPTSAPAAPAQFAGAGSPNQQVNLFLAPPATIKDGNGNSIPISMNLESTTITIDSTRAFTVGVGGTVTIGANQPDGVYTGTFTVLAQYN